ncbi:hypothetical protein DSM104299_05330 [Baekduia alba]|uniref:hypothetical protein n=1 Tax=Baekduia alba TaxID=2997333 RepID=UPI00233F85EC|nr:hypothetical protein [Baekduia alba]WCB96568.1 hypothetical protein DSM104299_05330 [Baekduia alba]
MTERPAKLTWTAIGLVAVAILLFSVRSPIGRSGDTIAMIAGTHLGLSCLGDGTLTNCGIHVAPYPLLQYLPTTLFIGLGLGDNDIERALGLLNVAAFVGMLLASYTTLARLARPALGVALLVVLVASPLPWYAWTTFGESLGAFACVAFVAAALWRAPAPVLALTLALAGVSKETALPFLALMGIGALLWSPIEGRGIDRRHWIGLGIGAVLALALTGAFNELRFGQLTNAVYSESYERTPTTGLKARFVLSLWLAPNAGLVTFWPLAGAALLAMVAVAAARVRRWREHLRPVGAGAVVLVCALAMTYGYANWYAPFGWIAWGPRLMLLLTPALLLFGAATLAPELQAVASAAGRWATALKVALAALAVATVLSQVGVLWDNQAQAGLFDPDSACPTSVSVVDNPGGYYHCIIHWAWYKHWVLPDAVSGVTTSFSSVLMTLAWLAALAALLVAVVLALRDRAGPRASAPVVPTPAPPGR